LQGIENSVQTEYAALNEYAKENNEWMLKEAMKEKVFRQTENVKDFKERIRKEHVDDWKEKPLHGKFYKDVQTFA